MIEVGTRSDFTRRIYKPLRYRRADGKWNQAHRLWYVFICADPQYTLLNYISALGQCPVIHSHGKIRSYIVCCFYHALIKSCLMRLRTVSSRTACLWKTQSSSILRFHSERRESRRSLSKPVSSVLAARSSLVWTIGSKDKALNVF